MPGLLAGTNHVPSREVQQQGMQQGVLCSAMQGGGGARGQRGRGKMTLAVVAARGLGGRSPPNSEQHAWPGPCRMHCVHACGSPIHVVRCWPLKFLPVSYGSHSRASVILAPVTFSRRKKIKKNQSLHHWISSFRPARTVLDTVRLQSIPSYLGPVKYYAVRLGCPPHYTPAELSCLPLTPCSPNAPL